jgi:hypothetical protein
MIVHAWMVIICKTLRRGWLEKERGQLGFVVSLVSITRPGAPNLGGQTRETLEAGGGENEKRRVGVHRLPHLKIEMWATRPILLVRCGPSANNVWVPYPSRALRRVGSLTLRLLSEPRANHRGSWSPTRLAARSIYPGPQKRSQNSVSLIIVPSWT